MRKNAVALAVVLIALATQVGPAACQTSPAVEAEEKTAVVEGATPDEAVAAATKWIDDHGGIFVHRITIRQEQGKSFASITYVEKW